MATPMRTYMMKALASKQRKGSKPSKSQIEARLTILMESMPSDEQYFRIAAFISNFYGGFDEKEADAFMHDLHNIMLTDPGKSMEDHEYYLEIFKI
jgi:hypothetical protein